MTTAVQTPALPSLPNGMKWEVRYKRAWAFLALRRKTWYGWKTVRITSVNPKGMSYQQALCSTALDLLDLDTVKA